MKVLKIHLLFILLFFAVILSLTSAVPDICKHRGRQMTVGQTFTDCYATVTCYPKGVLKIEDSCPSYYCARTSQLRGHKPFDSRKPYPDCCGGPICEDKNIKYYASDVRAYTPKSFLKRSPHVMGIKFA